MVGDPVTETEARTVVRRVLDLAEITATVDFDERFPEYQIHGMTVFTDPPKIWLSPVLLDDPDELLATAIHEAAHIVAGDDGHGWQFMEQLTPLMVKIYMHGALA